MAAIIDGTHKDSKVSPDKANVPLDTFNSKRWHINMTRMSKNLTTEADRRAIQRFRINAPLTILVGDHKIPAYTRDMSNRGVYFYLALSDIKLIDCNIEFVIEMPPEITHWPICRIQCKGRVMRKEEISDSLAGMSAQILDYSFLKEAMHNG